MSELEQDKDYKQIHKRYQQVSDEMPPAQLDAQILSAAHEAVEKESQKVTSIKQTAGMDTQPVKRAWYVPVSYVALLVISLSVVMKLAFEPFTLDSSSEAFDYPAGEESTMALSEMKDQSTEKSAPVVGLAMDMASGLSEQNLPESTASSSRLSTRPVPSAEKPTRLMAKREKIATEEQRIKVFEQAVREQQPEMASADISSVESLAEPPAPAALARFSTAAKQQAEIEKERQVRTETISEEIRQQPSELEQAAWVKKLEELYKQKQYESLKQQLEQYRKLYPLKPEEKALSPELLAWEKQHMPDQSQNP